MQISVSTSFYATLCVTCKSVYLHLTILNSVLRVDQCIYTILFFKLCYMQINVSTTFYTTLCVTCRSMYLHSSIPHSALHVDQCIYTVLFFILCYMQILHSVTFRSVYLHYSMLCSVLHLDQCIYTLLFFALCYMQISVLSPYYNILCVTCSVYTPSPATLYYMQISVSTPLYSLCVTCRYFYLPVLYLTLLHVDMFYTTLCVVRVLVIILSIITDLYLTVEWFMLWLLYCLPLLSKA